MNEVLVMKTWIAHHFVKHLIVELVWKDLEKNIPYFEYTLGKFDKT